MKPSFVAGFGPIVREIEQSRAFWGEGLGIELVEGCTRRSRRQASSAGLLTF